MNRSYLLKSPDQTYLFYTAIIGTNRRIYEESVDLCRRKNNFVCLTSRRPSSLAEKLEQCGLQVIAKGPKAHGFWNVSMTLTLDPVGYDGWPSNRFRLHETTGDANASEYERPWKHIFCSDELPNFCRLLLKLGKTNDSLLRNTQFYIEINPAISNGHAAKIDSTPAGLSRMQRLLEPLRQLHSFGAAHVEGPLSGTYKGSINASVCRNCPTAMDIIQVAMRALSQGDGEVNEDRLLQANQKYKSALTYTRSCCWWYDERNLIMNGGPFPGLKAVEAMANLKVRLQARIALVYLKRGMLRMARIYTERALDPRRPYDHRHNKLYSLDIEPWQGVVYAEVLHVAAQIRYIQGNVWEAKEDLSEAGQLVPLNEEQQSRYEAWQIRADILSQRRDDKEQARNLRSEKENEKTEGIETPDRKTLVSERRRLTGLFIALLLVACNWKDKGDRLLRRGRSELATSTYKVALSKIDSMGRHRNLYFDMKLGKFAGHCASDSTDALKFKLQASVAASYLMSRRYQDVIQSTDAALECCRDWRDCTHNHYRGCRHTYWDPNRDWRNDQKLDYLKAYYCKGLAHKHMGDTVRAVENLEKALSFDPGDGNVFAQLALLYRKLEEDETDRSKII